VIELLAVAEHPGPTPPDGVRELPCGSLAALCAPVDAEPELTEDALWRHEELVEELMRERDLLPVRYGTRLADEDEALRAVAERAQELRAALERVRGAVELSLRVRSARPGADPEPLRAPLRALAREECERRPDGEGELLRCAYLVDRERIDEFSATVGRLQQAHPELALLLTGPWPPYSFTTAKGSGLASEHPPPNG
jgi:Gas vesicle synthesis protein GvpL/GvpF